VLEREVEIANLAQTLATGADAPRVERTRTQLALADTEHGIGGPLTGGQRAAALEVMTSGRGIELVVGVAGSGKTTALAAVAAGFEAEGYDVVGTATSGQAARGLGKGAGIDESRTLASLLWRLDHERLALSERHVVVLDEAGMTTDTDLGRLLIATEAAGAKVIVVGDDRQLGAVGPGGGMGALLARHPDAVHHLTENVRQHDIEERLALAELRAGDVSRAVDWYASHERIWVSPSRTQAIEAMVGAWATDVAEGRDAVMLAYRRASVAELNAKGRTAWRELGRLSGPELCVEGRACAAGDLVVMLHPGPDGAWVTSERASVVSVDPKAMTMEAEADDGRRLHLEGEDLGADRLSHAYAITVHRSQGATVDRSYALEDGGGRELAYVKMSRARDAAQLYMVAQPSHALERLEWAWEDERRQSWVIDRAEVEHEPVFGIADLERRRRELGAQIPPDRSEDLDRARTNLATIEADWAHLASGTGPWAHTTAGQASRSLTEVRDHRDELVDALEHETGALRRRRLSLELRGIERDLRTAESEWSMHVGPHWQRLDADRQRALENVEGLEAAQAERAQWLERHPDVLEQVAEIDHDLAAERDRRRELDRLELERRLHEIEIEHSRGIDDDHAIDIGF
ncbi:MAG: AAA family ATPase, partial [Acidimicrobiia bacterium]|nr:AAA family ATPase [Acidimicrobiia bacterium]